MVQLRWPTGTWRDRMKLYLSQERWKVWHEQNKFLIITDKEDLSHIEDSLFTINSEMWDINIFSMRDDLEYWKIIIDVKAHSASFLLSWEQERPDQKPKKGNKLLKRFSNSCYRKDLKCSNLKFIKKMTQSVI